MWPRIFELFIAGWLFFSSIVFDYPSDLFLWISDAICSFLITIFAILSFFKRFEKMHLYTIVIALWMLGGGFILEAPLPILQNQIIASLFLAMFAILPSHCNRSPRLWREFYRKKTYL